MIKRIVLTGGPSSGKTTVLERIKKVYSTLGYKVILVKETATELINNEIKPFGENSINLLDFQELILSFQLSKEKLYDRAVELMGECNTIIVYDRGTIDNSAYISKEEFETVLAKVNGTKNFLELMNKYDLVINLVGKSDFYTTENNKARSETADEAIKLGEATLKSWLGHPKLKIVLPKQEMEDKIKEVLNLINGSLKESHVIRQEKYLVDLNSSNLEYIKRNGRFGRITQDYLMSNSDTEKRIRKIELMDSVIYNLTVYQKKPDGTKIIISDKEIEKKIYESLLEFKEENTKTIQKTRIYFNYKGKYFYLDIFDNNNELGILEINISENEQIETPDFLNIIENVTHNEKYYNKEISTKKGKELKLI